MEHQAVRTSTISTPASPYKHPFPTTQISRGNRFEVEVSRSDAGLGARVPRTGLSRLSTNGVSRSLASPSAASLRMKYNTRVEEITKDDAEHHKRHIIPEKDSAPAGERITSMVAAHVQTVSSPSGRDVPQRNQFRFGPSLPLVREPPKTFGSPLFRMAMEGPRVRSTLRVDDESTVADSGTQSVVIDDIASIAEKVDEMPIDEIPDTPVAQEVGTTDMMPSTVTPTLVHPDDEEKADENANVDQSERAVAHKPLTETFETVVLDTSTHPLVRLIGPEEAAKDMLRPKEPTESRYGTPTVSKMVEMSGVSVDDAAYTDGPGLPSPKKHGAM
ncbi:hypothetical protein J8273_4190 [Carpediemonas membranifera]|uniref:Uncharacterized protein n=1 Tax=Carpediemonas membranifera TaxID=201153 RepID=A0A8J6ATX7_9EUKA|nr:hypothetical protein J8273_4190 [Carpediemonas membranifera]|eukprot:KAG9394516.1 hypothetical protein J8273_4190 [Carpediemonas membranifera]